MAGAGTRVPAGVAEATGTMDDQEYARFRDYVARLPPWSSSRLQLRTSLVAAIGLTLVTLLFLVLLLTTESLGRDDLSFVSGPAVFALAAWASWYSSWLVRGARTMLLRSASPATGRDQRAK